MDVRNSIPGLLNSTTTLTAAQIRALNTTPVTLVPAPGAGRIVAVDSQVYVYNFGTHAFDSQAIPALFTVYASAPLVSLLTLSQTTFTQASSQFSFANSVTGPPQFAQSVIVNQPVQLLDQANYNAGPIITATLGVGGTGYVANDTGTIQQNNNDATYKVLTIGAGGAVLTFQITGNGTQYVPANGVATATGGAQPGVGTGFTVNITAVTVGDGTLRVVTYYQVVPVP